MTYAPFGPWSFDITFTHPNGVTAPYLSRLWRIADAEGNEIEAVTGDVTDAGQRAAYHARHTILGEREED